MTPGRQDVKALARKFIRWRRFLHWREREFQVEFNGPLHTIGGNSPVDIAMRNNERIFNHDYPRMSFKRSTL